MQAIILAAGLGKRLKSLTKNNTKCMVEVNGTTLIERMICQLEQLNLTRLVIVVGYKKEVLIDYIEHLNSSLSIEYINNPDYSTTNNIYSLFLAREYLLEDDTILLESDLIFDSGILNSLIDDERATLALVDKYESWMDGTVVKIDEDDNIIDFVPGNKFKSIDIPHYYKTVNIYKFSKDFSSTHYVPFLEAYSKAMGNNEYYEQVLRILTLLDNETVKVKRLSGENWYEIDDIQDLDIAESIFTPSTLEHTKKLTERLGGYWRYPKLQDSSTPCNPYYPPSRLLDEMTANFDMLITRAPSNETVDCLLAAKILNTSMKNIIVATDPYLLASNVVANFGENIGIVGLIPNENKVFDNSFHCSYYMPHNKNLSYNSKDIIKYFDARKIDALFLMNPDLIAGNCLSFEECITLVQWCLRKGINFILDESFVDLANLNNCQSPSLMSEETINRYSNLFLIKDLSLSHGILGLQLAVLATCNREVLQKINMHQSQQRISSIAEFYLQIAEKYKQDYEESIVKNRRERQRIFEKLNSIPGLRPLPSQTNYLLIELHHPFIAEKLVDDLCNNYSILIKSLSLKNSHQNANYVRIAIKSSEENEILMNLFKELSAKYSTQDQ